jgi:NDP-sugar pyrophosphorylase family protein
MPGKISTYVDHYGFEFQAGPLALAREVLAKNKSPFFVLNSDIICEYPFEELRDFHAAHGNEGTIVVRALAPPNEAVILCGLL